MIGLSESSVKAIWILSGQCSLFILPKKTKKNFEILWCLQRDQNGSIGMNWINQVCFEGNSLTSLGPKIYVLYTTACKICWHFKDFQSVDHEISWHVTNFQNYCFRLIKYNVVWFCHLNCKYFKHNSVVSINFD